MKAGDKITVEDQDNLEDNKQVLMLASANFGHGTVDTEFEGKLSSPSILKSPFSSAKGDVGAKTSVLDQLFETYGLSEAQCRAFHVVRAAKNMPSLEMKRFVADLNDEEIVWAVAVATFDMPADPTVSELKSFDQAVEQRVRRLEEAERTYGWFSLQWTPAVMRRLIITWFCGMLVIDPALQTKGGSPIQFVYEFYGEGSQYPDHEGQTEEWKKESIDLYVLMARSICRAYPTATTKGIVSFSDMQDFDWDKYDMESKSRNADISSLVPNKLSRMITFHPDEKMRGFYEDMSKRMRKKYGFVLYDDFQSAKDGEGDFLPEELPTFVGGSRRVDILECLKHLFHREPEALELLLDTYAKMEASGEIPQPIHMGGGAE